MKLALFLLSISSLIAQETPTSIGAFTSLKIQDGLNVTLISSEENRIQISGERKDYVTVTNIDGKLKIRMKTPKKLGGFNTNRELFYNQRIEKIDATEGAFVSSNDVFMQPSILLSARKGGEIDLSLDVQKATYKAFTGGKITTKGSGKVQQIQITTGGVVQSQQVDSEQTQASLSGGGVSDISASTIVQIKTKFGGYVRVHGKPAQLEHSRFLGGNVTIVALSQQDE